MAQRTGFHAYICVPLKAKEKIIGVMNFLSHEAHEFSAKDIALFSSMANQIGVALENASLFEQVKTRSQQLSAINAIAATVSQSLDPDVVLKEALEKVVEILGFDAGWLHIVDPSGKELYLRAQKGISHELSQALAHRGMGEGISGKVAETGEPLVFEDIQTDPRYLQITKKRVALLAGFRAEGCFPIRSKEKLFGSLTLARCNPYHFSPDELQLIYSIASEIGVGVENARLFEETVKSAQELSALYTVTSTVNQSLDLDRVLQEVIEKITEIFHFDTTRIYLLGPHAEELHVRASYPVNREDMSRVRVFRIGEGVVGKVTEIGEPIIFEDLQSDPRYQELSSTKNTQKTGNRFLAAFPIPAKLKTIGTIVCNGRTPRRLTPGEIQLITSMAGQIGVAVENASLFYETKQKSVELEKANIELLEANRAKADFLAAMSHELRTPLNVIIGNADLVKDGTFGDISAKQKSALDKILHYSETLLKLINDVLTLTKVEAKKVSLNLSTFFVGEIVAHTQSYVEQLNRNGRLKVLWEVKPNLPPMTTD
ncbi:MAG: GAF domain-containing protein, partial [Candidatus Binatota bacterium]